MSALLEDLQEATDWIAEALGSSGYQADFSPQSLWVIDRFLDDHSANGKARRGGLLAQDLGSRIFALGGYVGEVVRRDQGGVWKVSDQDPESEIDVEVVLDNGTSIWPVQRVMKRFSNGPEDGIAAYGAALGLLVGQEPPAPKKPGLFGRRK